MPEVSADVDTASWRRFLLLWGSQTASMTAGGLTYFALGIWVFQQTGSATAFALMTIATTLPGVLALPLAGSLSDRFGGRLSLIASDVGSATVGLAIAAFFYFDVVSTWSLCALLGIGSVLASLHWPAYTSVTSELAQGPQLPRAASMMQFGYVGHHVLAPVVAPSILAIAGVSGILAIDVVSFAIASVAILLLLRPRRRVSKKPRSVREEFGEAWAAVRERELLPLAAYVAATYLFGGTVVALSTPLVITIAGPQTAGIVLGVMGVGMIVGTTSSSVFVKSSGGTRRLLGFDRAMAIAMLMAGVAASPTLIAVAGFLFLFGLGGHMGEEQALWQVRIPLALQGRAFALKRMLTFGALPLSYALAGPLADYVLEPLMADQGALAHSAGSLIGTGPGRGMALLLMLAGVGKLLVIFLAARSTRLRALNAAPSERE